MKSKFIRGFVLFISLSIVPYVAQAQKTIVGVNVVGVQNLSKQQQDALVEQLQKEGVHTIRTSLGDKFTYFITSAFRHGIGAVVIVDPTAGSISAAQHVRPADPPLTTWKVGRLSDADPEGFKQWLGPQMAALQRNGVKLTALEIGNELNSAGYNGDFNVPARV
jgi:hypothetical protein